MNRWTHGSVATPIRWFPSHKRELKISQPRLFWMGSLIVGIPLHRIVQDKNDADPDDIDYGKAESIALWWSCNEASIWQGCFKAMPVMTCHRASYDCQEMNQSEMHDVINKRSAPVNFQRGSQPCRLASGQRGVNPGKQQQKDSRCNCDVLQRRRILLYV